VGKTTLVAQAGRVAHAQGARVLYGRCDEDLGVPYQHAPGRSTKPSSRTEARSSP
jgi:hypothetical protein